MTSWNSPHASVLLSCGVKWHPNATNGERICNKERTIFVGWYFSSDSWVLENVHRLSYHWILKKHNFFTKSLHNSRITETFKSWMEIMHGMTNFVEGLSLWYNEVTICVLCIFFEKWFHLPGWAHEVILSVIVFCFKVFNLFFFKIKFVNYICHFIFHYLNSICIINLVEDGISVFPEIFHSLMINLLSQILIMNR